MVEAVESAKHPKATVEAKASTRSDADDGTPLSSSENKTVLSQNASAEEESAVKGNGLQADAVNSGGVKKVRRKAPPPPRPPLPTHHKTIASVASSENCGVKDVTKSSAQGHSDEKVSYNADSQSLPARRKGRKKKNKIKYPKELNPFGSSSSSEEEPSFLLDGASPTEQTPLQENDEITSKVLESGDDEEKTSHSEVPSSSERRKKCRGFKKSSKFSLKTQDPFSGSSDEEAAAASSKEPEGKSDDDEEKASHNEIPSPPQRRRKRRGLKRANKYPKALNPFGGFSDEEAATVSSKEPERKSDDDEEKMSYTEFPSPSGHRGKGFSPFDGSSGEEAVTQSSKKPEMKASSTPNVTDQSDGEQRSPNTENVELRKAKPHNPENDVEASTRDKSATSLVDVASGGDERPLSPEPVLLSVHESEDRAAPKDVPENEKCPARGDSSQAVIEGGDDGGVDGGATISAGASNDQREDRANDTHENSQKTAPAVGLHETEDTDSAAMESEKQRLSFICQNLSQSGPPKPDEGKRTRDIKESDVKTRVGD